MKIYTRTGDKGKTFLITGENVDKDDPRICFYGLLDELSSYMGWLMASLKEYYNTSWTSEIKILTHAQELLFRLPMAFVKDNNKTKTVPSDEDVDLLEKYIDATDKELNGIFKGFILPGGNNIIAAQAHVVRSVCRRIERDLYSLKKQSQVINELMQKDCTEAYINRLSDFLYTLGQRLEKK